MRITKIVLASKSAEDLITEIDLPSNLSKLTQFQKMQCFNLLRHLDKKEFSLRLKNLNIALSIAKHKPKKNKKELDTLMELSDLFYEANLLRTQDKTK